MKIFDWVHRKFLQNNGQSVKQSDDGQGVHLQGNPRKGAWRSARCKDVIKEDGAADMTGLLAIGTFGVEPLAKESQEFRKVVERVDSEVTAGEVDLFYDHLEKAFGLKTNDDVCPLHQFFHSPLTDPATRPNPNNNKESRTSLGDLFSNSNQESSPTLTPTPSKDHDPDPDHADAPQISHQKPNVDEAKPGSLSFVKKVLKRKTCNNSGQGLESGRKLDKLIGLFQRRIHPEETAGCKLGRPHAKGTIFKGGAKHNKSFALLAHCFLPRPCDNKDDGGIDDEVVKSSAQLCTLQEHWIKTDAEYVVLEL